MQVTVQASHRKYFNMSGTYCAGQVLNCIMSIYDILTTDLHKWIFIVKQDGSLLPSDLVDIPAGTVFECERLDVFVVPKSVTLTF